ncbi:MAG TPA: hemerythrin domain-containing protein, partial [Mycobacteriales bacterium]
MTDNPTPPVGDPVATHQATGEPGSDRQLQTLAAIRSHHQALGRAVDEGAVAVLDSVDRLAPGSHRADLVRLCEQVVLPHAVAEEHTLYLAGSDLPELALLVRAMLDEHVALRAVVDALAQARTPGAIAGAAASLRMLFAVHLTKENELLLPALLEAGVDIATLLDGMHEILGPADGHGHGHGGGCGC